MNFDFIQRQTCRWDWRFTVLPGAAVCGAGTRFGSRKRAERLKASGR